MLYECKLHNLYPRIVGFFLYCVYFYFCLFCNVCLLFCFIYASIMIVLNDYACQSESISKDTQNKWKSEELDKINCQNFQMRFMKIIYFAKCHQFMPSQKVLFTSTAQRNVSNSFQGAQVDV